MGVVWLLVSCKQILLFCYLNSKQNNINNQKAFYIGENIWSPFYRRKHNQKSLETTNPGRGLVCTPNKKKNLHTVLNPPVKTALPALQPFNISCMWPSFGKKQAQV